MYEDIRKYLEKPLNERKSHLNLDEDCIEIGGDSRTCRGLMAHTFKTTMNWHRAYVCHACGNSKCSNISHMYWGSPRENHDDQRIHGTYVSPYQRMVNKYGEEGAKRKMSEISKKRDRSKKNIVLLDKNVIQSRLDDLSNDTKRGRYSRLANKWNISHTQVRRFEKKFAPGGFDSFPGYQN